MRSFSALQLSISMQKEKSASLSICTVIHFLVKSKFYDYLWGLSRKISNGSRQKVNQVVKDNGRFILEAISLFLEVSKGDLSFSRAV